MLIGCRETLVRDRARGLVGYDVALTRRRSPVRIRPGPWHSPSVLKKFHKYTVIIAIKQKFNLKIMSSHENRESQDHFCYFVPVWCSDAVDHEAEAVLAMGA